ncbi:FUSC family protein [Aeromonas salmonicida]|uniref:FUSC family protein n=1 Tax=Aeromonas salmonicida TaxID=645 RepID=UPI003D19F68A
MRRSAKWLQMLSNDYVRLGELFGILFASLPCIALFLYCHDSGWLTIGLISASLYLTQTSIKWGWVGLLLHWSVILVGISILFISFPYPWLFALLTALLAGGCIAISHWGCLLRSLGSWVIIPAVYIACELHAKGGSSSYMTLMRGVPVALLGPILLSFMNGHSWQRASLRSYLGQQSTSVWPMVFGIVVAVFIAALCVDTFQLEHGQWMIWSVVSVSTGERQSMYQKLGGRIKGGLLGSCVGLAGLMLPHVDFMASMSVFLTPLTLVVRNYSLSFACRCMLIVLSTASLHQGETIALYRLLNVLAGGILGVSIGWLFIKLASSRYFSSYHG